MSSPDVLDHLLSSNPNEPATNGVVLLLRAEMKSEFRSLRTESGGKLDALDQRVGSLEGRFDHLETRFDKIQGSLDMIAQQVAIIVRKIG